MKNTLYRYVIKIPADILPAVCDYMEKNSLEYHDVGLNIHPPRIFANITDEDALAIKLTFLADVMKFGITKPFDRVKKKS